MYAKLIEGRMMPAPHMLKTDQGDVYNPSGDILLQEGYKPVVYTPYPEAEEESGVVYAETWQEINGQIVQGWTEREETDAPPEAPSELDALRAQVAELQAAIWALVGEEGADE